MQNFTLFEQNLEGKKYQYHVKCCFYFKNVLDIPLTITVTTLPYYTKKLVASYTFAYLTSSHKLAPCQV